MNVSVLFARKDSFYKTMGLDVYDIERDARTWTGGNPIVAHPPCRAWGQLSHFANPRPDEKELAIWAIAQIRQWGGVLEHPRASKLWPTLGLPMPGEYDDYGGFSLCVDQFWWGHRAQKNTLLYICGCRIQDVPPMPMRLDAVQFTIASRIKKKSGRRLKPEIPKSEREKTPPDMAKWLVELAAKCSKSYNHE